MPRDRLTALKKSRTVILAQRGVVLATTLGLAAAIVALGGFLSIGWLVGLGLGIALVGGLLRVLSALGDESKQLQEGERDQKARTRVPVGEVGDIDPTHIGIDPAPQSVLPGGEVPQYLSRRVDEKLDQAISDGIDGSGRFIVVAVGSSKVGKSRAMFEALRRQANNTQLHLVAPTSYEGLRALMAPGQLAEVNGSASVLWLDDLEPFVDQGMTLQTLEQWRERFGTCIVAGTYGGKRSSIGDEAAGESIGTIYGEILRRSNQVHLGRTSEEEIDGLPAGLAEDVLTVIKRHGLAAYLVAGPELATKLATRRQKAMDRECPEGIAVVNAAVDWARAGRTDPIPKAALEELWRSYLPPGSHHTEDGFESGLMWALEPVAGTIALLEDVGGYRPYDYVVELIRSESGAQMPQDPVWPLALKDATDAQALSVGGAAFTFGRLADTQVAFEIAARSPIDSVAATATVNYGVVLGQRDLREREIAAYDDVVGRFGEAGELELREQVAKALFNRPTPSVSSIAMTWRSPPTRR